MRFVQHIRPFWTKSRQQIQAAFDRPGTFHEVRESLAQSAERLLLGVHELKLRGLCLRLADRSLADEPWLEALGGFVCGKPPASWLDTNVDRFRDNLYRFAMLYKRVEAAAFD